MRTRIVTIASILLVSLASCSADDGNNTGDGSTRRDAASDARGTDTVTPTDTQPIQCVDTDNDGISVQYEGNADDDGDGIPNTDDDDCDGDGFTDILESVGNYPRYMSNRPPLMCGESPDDCDGDGRPNFRDLDSDNDGLTDAEEVASGSNPCAIDSDGDGIDDLTERAAGSDPTTATSMPPADALYVTLPYHPPGTTGDHPHREFTFQTRIRAADIVFVVDTTGSMGATISAVQSTLSSRIIPGIVAALGTGGDARYAIAGHGDFANGGTNSDGAMRLYQRLDANASLSQTATGGLSANGGGDGPEAMVPAMHALISGFGVAGYGGTATRPVTAADCGGDAEAFGWACFRPGRVPIMVLFSDADWHNGPGQGQFYSVSTAGTYAQLESEMVRRNAFFVGIDVGGGATYANSQTLARATGTIDGAGQPIAFMGAPATVADSVINAVTTIASQVRQDITTRTEPDATEMRLMSPHTTAEFVEHVTPARGIPDAPAGFDHMDTTTFYSVLPSTQVVFGVDFFNNFQPGGSSATVYRATIRVLGRAGAEVDHRDVFIVVPADGAGLPG